MDIKERKNTSWLDAKERWLELGIKTAIAIPDFFLTDHSDAEKVSNRKGMHRLIIRVLIVLVVILALASIGNMVSRALKHHNGFNAYASGIALAALVPISVFITAALFNDTKRRAMGWAISSVFATVSATIQFYAYSSGALFSIEAFAFGAGIPVAECLLAVLAAAVESQIEEEEEAEIVASSKAKEKADNEVEAAESRRRKAIDDEARRKAELAFEMEQRGKDAEELRENRRLDAQAKREEKLIKLQAKVGVKSGVKSDSVKSPSTSGNKADDRRVKLMEILQSIDSPSDINKTKLATALGVSRPTIINDIHSLESSGRISLNGKVEVKDV